MKGCEPAPTCRDLPVLVQVSDGAAWIQPMVVWWLTLAESICLAEWFWLHFVPGYLNSQHTWSISVRLRQQHLLNSRTTSTNWKTSKKTRTSPRKRTRARTCISTETMNTSSTFLVIFLLVCSLQLTETVPTCRLQGHLVHAAHNLLQDLVWPLTFKQTMDT